MHTLDVLVCSWKLRGLGDLDKCRVVIANLLGHGIHILCLKETKIAAVDKNNSNLDVVAASAFNDAIDTLLLQELPLLDRQYTWYKMRVVPTLVCLD